MRAVERRAKVVVLPSEPLELLQGQVNPARTAVDQRLFEEVLGMES